MSNLEILESELQTFQIDLEVSQKATLAAYCDELTRWNKKINLTGLRGAALVRRLVVEPAWIGLQLKANGTLLDIGSGNGSPAIPLHVISQFRKCHLVEARTKRAAFLRHLSVALKLPDIEVHHGRFEDVAGSIEPPDWVTLQAVALTSDLMKSIQQMSRPTTTVVWITSSSVDLEGRTPKKTFGVPITGTQVVSY
ncbi:MAG TPA: RsmG family class I SAM-dependent methyltransferase [Terriglobia bacterium]|nr:RsmG family class I SAM-dependent methyltransferase [Terriglobia bacterium]